MSFVSFVLNLYWRVYRSFLVQHTVIIQNLYWYSLAYGISLHRVNQSRNLMLYQTINILTNCSSLYACCTSSLYSSLTTLIKLLLCRNLILLSKSFKLIFLNFSFLILQFQIQSICNTVNHFCIYIYPFSSH